jgi:predicted Zn-dependent peptidase
MVNSFIAKEDLATEMTVVRNEMEMGENNPGRVLLQRTLAAMYDWHNYGKSTIGARRTSRTSTSRACRPSTAATTSPTTPR